MKKENRNNKGFSLVELIVVIAIMAVLVGVLAPQFIKWVDKSRQATDIQTADQVATALKTYYSDKENPAASYDVTLSDTLAPSGSGTDATDDVGLKDAKLKSKAWGTIKVTLDTTTGKITYDLGTGTGKCYYKENSDSTAIVAE